MHEQGEKDEKADDNGEIGEQEDMVFGQTENFKNFCSCFEISINFKNKIDTV